MLITVSGTYFKADVMVSAEEAEAISCSTLLIWFVLNGIWYGGHPGSFPCHCSFNLVHLIGWIVNRYMIWNDTEQDLRHRMPCVLVPEWKGRDLGENDLKVGEYVVAHANELGVVFITRNEKRGEQPGPFRFVDPKELVQ